EITKPIESQADGPTVGEGRWTDEAALCAIRGKLIDGVIQGAGREEISRSVKGKAEPLAGKRPKCALTPCGSDLIDRGGTIRVGITHSHDKDVARGVHRQATTEKVAANRGKGALDAVRSNFHNAWLKRTGNGVERVGYHKKIAGMVKGDPSRPGKAGSKGALHSARVVLVNKAAAILGIAINRSEQVVHRAICCYCAYSQANNRERRVDKFSYCFHLFLSFIILLQNVPGRVWKKSFQNRKNSELWSGIRTEE